MGTVSGKHHNRLRVGHRVLYIPEQESGLQPVIGIVTELSEQSNNRVFLHPVGGRVTVAATADRCILIKGDGAEECTANPKHPATEDELKAERRKIRKRARRLAQSAQA
jgi:hypothetical protein